jgi:hypothetical protein
MAPRGGRGEAARHLPEGMFHVKHRVRGGGKPSPYCAGGQGRAYPTLVGRNQRQAARPPVRFT